ncbi:hypothetical protein ACWV2X_17010 [Streptomyces hydrogenans]
MDDDEMRRRFDGAARVQLMFRRGYTPASKQRAEAIGHALGYRPVIAESAGWRGIRLTFARDEAPDARRRRELTIARLRSGGPVLPPMETPPPPAPLPRHRPHRRREPLAPAQAARPRRLPHRPRHPRPCRRTAPASPEADRATASATASIGFLTNGRWPRPHPAGTNHSPVPCTACRGRG